MAWTDELLTAQYTSPLGTPFTFLYKDVAKETDLKTSTYTFPSKDGALVQSLGRGGRRFPLECVFSGPDCTAQADDFEKGLEQKGIGELQHPLYGTRKVVPTGTVKRTDSLSSGGNVSTVSVTFAETITDAAMPDGKTSRAEAVEKKYRQIESKACEEFAREAEAGDTSSLIKMADVMQQAAKASYTAMERIAQENLSPPVQADSGSPSVSGGGMPSPSSGTASSGSSAAGASGTFPAQRAQNEKAWESFQALETQTVELAAPAKVSARPGRLDFALSLFATFKLPSVSVSFPSKTVSAYVDADVSVGAVFGKGKAGISHGLIKKQDVKNRYQARLLSSTAIVSGAAHAVLVAAGATDTKAGTGFRNRAEAMEAMMQLEELYDSYAELSDEYARENISPDTSTAASDVQEMLCGTASYLLMTAFSLPSQRTITLGRDRQLLELVAELYGGLSRVDEFIQENNLNADELEVIPMGREVSYYVV